MPCEKGKHQHLGARGQMLGCHKITDKHDNATAQRYHLIALNQGAGDTTADIGITSTPRDVKQDKKEQFFTPEQKQIINANKKKIKQFIKLMASSKMGKLFVPVIATMSLCDTVSNKSLEITERAKSKRDMTIARSYQDGVDMMYQILKKHNLLDKDVSEMTDSEVASIKEDFKKEIAS